MFWPAIIVWFAVVILTPWWIALPLWLIMMGVLFVQVYKNSKALGETQAALEALEAEHKKILERTFR